MSMVNKMAVGLLVCLLSTGAARAAWYVCHVDGAGCDATGPVFLFTCVSSTGFDSFSGQAWFRPSGDTTAANRYMATILTALSSGKNVMIEGPASPAAPPNTGNAMTYIQVLQ